MVPAVPAPASTAGVGANGPERQGAVTPTGGPRRWVSPAARDAIGSGDVSRRGILAAACLLVAGVLFGGTLLVRHVPPPLQPSPRQIREMLAEATREDLGGPRFGPPPAHDFYFTRAAYTSYGWRGWSVDYPKADVQFLIGLRRITNLDSYENENSVLLTDPDLGRYPFLYTVEVGHMAMTDEEVLALRRYLHQGGFLVVDDFWGTAEWVNFAHEMGRVLPGRPIEDIPLDHPVFRAFFEVDEIVQVPNVGQGIRGGPTWERDGYNPVVRGIFDDEGRLMVLVNWNTDLGDAWEWAENPYYPLHFSNYAYAMGINFIIYAMAH